jgi:hypothetical protein
MEFIDFGARNLELEAVVNRYLPQVWLISFTNSSLLWQWDNNRKEKDVNSSVETDNGMEREEANVYRQRDEM